MKGGGGGGRVVRNKYTLYCSPPSLMGANPLTGPLEGLGPENRDFLGPEMASSETDGWKKPPFSGPTFSFGPCNGFARIKIIMSSAIKIPGTLKGHGNEADFLDVLQKLVPLRSLTLHFETFRFWLWIRGDIHNHKNDSPTQRVEKSPTWQVREWPTLRLRNIV